MDAGPGLGWQRLHEAIERHQRFLLTSHIFPEGDSLGSEVAFALHLHDRGKSVHVLNPTPPRECYGFLMDTFPIHTYNGQEGDPTPAGTDAIVALDVGQWEYMGRLGEVLRNTGLFRVAIDHHHPVPGFANLELNDPEASSTGEMLYHYFRWSGARITPAMAHALYASVMFDTGGLRMPQTRNQTVLVAAELLRYGADHRAVMSAIFQSETFERVHLYRRALELLRYEPAPRLAWISIPHGVFLETGTALQDADGILDNLLAIHEVDLCALFRETVGSGVRVTFRSKGRHDVGRIARRLGGGGRPTAAGLYLGGGLAEAEERILPILRRMNGAPVPSIVPVPTELQA